MKRISTFATLVFFSCLLTACCSSKKSAEQPVNQAVSIPGPKTIIYKTTKEYSKLVPINLSEDKKSVVSYPDVRDVFHNGNLAYPAPLHDGFLLDNRGISANVAFLRLTYEEYANLPKTPTPEDLMKMIIDPDPLLIMYFYNKQPNRDQLEQELNTKIDSGDFSDFTKVK